MFGLGWLEVGVIILLAVLFFGPKKIPELGGALGKTLKSFKAEMEQPDEANSDLDREDDRG